MAQAEFHGPINIINTGLNVWGGDLNFIATAGGGDTAVTFTGLSTKTIKTTAHVLLTPANAIAAFLYAGSSQNNTGVWATITTQGTITLNTWKGSASSAKFSFLVYDGGTSL
jgi:hypothetical protein